MIHLDHDYHVVELSRPLPYEVYEWLKTKFGLGNGDRWFFRNNKIYFTNAPDHLMFILTWGDK
jgi:hypothetical protein